MKHVFKYARKVSTSRVAILLIVFVCSSCTLEHAHSSNTPAPVINDSSWIFTATYTVPQTGRSGPVNGNYTVTYTPAKLRVYLPYFGEAYGGADVMSSDNPLDFTSTDFSGVPLRGKKGEHNIVIKPADNARVSSMSFTFYDNGNAHLDVIMNNRSGISFNGNVR